MNAELPRHHGHTSISTPQILLIKPGSGRCPRLDGAGSRETPSCAPTRLDAQIAKDLDVFGLVGQIFEQMTKELFGFFLGSSRVNHGFVQWM